MRKAKKLIIFLTCIAIVVVIGSVFIGNPKIYINNQRLKNSLKSIDSELVQLNDVVPFEWDTVYTFEPYQSKESIEKVVGFKSRDIKANTISEGMLTLLFVKNNRVVASVLGKPSVLGYQLEFCDKITFSQRAQFSVTKTDGIITLTYVKW